MGRRSFFLLVTLSPCHPVTEGARHDLRGGVPLWPDDPRRAAGAAPGRELSGLQRQGVRAAAQSVRRAARHPSPPTHFALALVAGALAGGGRERGGAAARLHLRLALPD